MNLIYASIFLLHDFTQAWGNPFRGWGWEAEGEAMHRKILKFQTLNGKIKKLTDLFIYSL